MNNVEKVYEVKGKLGVLKSGIYRVLGCTTESTVLSTINILEENIIVPKITIPTVTVLMQDDMVLVKEKDGVVTVYKYTNSKFVYSLINGKLLEYPIPSPSLIVNEELIALLDKDHNTTLRLAAAQGYDVGSPHVKVVDEVSYGNNKVLIVDRSMREAYARGKHIRPARYMSRCGACAGCKPENGADLLEVLACLLR